MSKPLAIIHHLDLYGRRNEKYDTLERLSIQDAEWTTLTPQSPYYFMVPKDLSLDEEYQRGFSVGEMLPVNVTGIVTARDGLVIADTREELLDRMRRFFDPNKTDDQVRAEFFGNKKEGKYLAGDSRGWRLTEARKLLMYEDHTQHIREISYRPFDTKYIYYHPKMVDWGRGKIMKHVIDKSNIGLDICRQGATDVWTLVGIVNRIVDDSFVSNRTKERGYLFPLYLYTEDGGLGGETSEEE